MSQATLLPTKEVYYLYGLVQLNNGSAELESPVAQSEILAKRGRIAAVGLPVSEDEFSPDEVTRHFNDIDWVSRVATAHYGSCERIFRSAWPGGFLPFRICTVFSSLEVIQQLLEERQADFEAEFERLTGKAEFGLKISVTKEWLETKALTADAGLRQLQAETLQDGGKAFFARKRLETELKESKKRLIPQLGRRLVSLISQALGLDTSQAVRSFNPGPTSADYVSLVNMALLLPGEQEEQLLKLANALDQEVLGGSALVEQLGPLPPFSFIRLEPEKVAK